MPRPTRSAPKGMGANGYCGGARYGANFGGTLVAKATNRESKPHSRTHPVTERPVPDQPMCSGWPNKPPKMPQASNLFYISE